MEKVYIADDDKSNRYFLNKILSFSGYNVTAFNNGKELLDAVLISKPDLIITDVKMPMMDGFEFLYLIRDKLGYEYLPIIFTSATYKDIESKIKGFELGVNDYIVSPIEENEFIAKVKSMLRTKDLYDQLHISREELNLTLHSIGDALISTDTDGNIIRMNQVAEEMTGYVIAEVLGKHVNNVLHIVNAKTNKKVDNPVKKVLEKGITIGLANHSMLISRNGKKLNIIDSAAPIKDHEGKILGVVMVLRDNTKEYRLKEELIKSEEKYHAVFEFTGTASMITSEDNMIIEVNKECEQLFGYSANDLIDKNWNELLHKDDSDLIQEFLKNNSYDSKASLLRREVRIYNIHNETKYAILSIGKIQKSHTFIISFVDITDQKQAEFKQKKLESQLIQIQKMESIGRLAGGIAHDYNNKLTVILGYTGIALKKVRADKQLHSDLHDVFKAASQAKDITRQLLAFARKQTINPRTLDLNETVASMLKMLQRLIGEDISLVWKPGANLQIVQMDPTQIDQILANLCLNARDAINGIGEIIIKTSNALIDENFCYNRPGFVPGNYVKLSVIDNGRGMDNHTKENIFEPFFTTKNPDQGTGLGMAMVYGIVKQNDGLIAIESQLKKGTAIDIYLPYSKCSVKKSAEKISADVFKGKGETVLLVEDEKAIMNIGKRMLEMLNYKVITANTPQIAIKLAVENSNNIHLLITDVVMPEMNGRELSKQLHKKNPDMKVLYMSGYTANIIAQRGVLEKDMNFIQKPFSSKDLGEKIWTILNQKNSNKKFPDRF